MSAGDPLLAYARWQLRDALLRGVTPVILFLVMAGIPVWTMVANTSLAAMRTPGRLQDGALGIYTNTMTLAMTLGAFVLIGGVIALDRERQHFRFLFSHPVAPWTFYLQQFVISFVLFTICFASIPLAFGALITAVPVLAVVKSAALYALLFGSLAFLCGTLANKDGVLLIGIALVTSVLQAVDRAGQLNAVLSAVARWLPPLNTADRVRTHWLAERAADSGDVWLVVGYSLAMLVAALVILRRAPLAR